MKTAIQENENVPMNVCIRKKNDDDDNDGPLCSMAKMINDARGTLLFTEFVINCRYE